MGAVNSLQGSIASGATAGPTKNLLDNLGIDGCTLTVNNPVADSTVDGSNFKGSLPGLGSWTVSCPFKFPATPQHGHKPTGGAAFITGISNGYTTGVKAFGLTISVPVERDTDETATDWDTFMYSDVIAATGTYTANVDSATALVVPGQTDTALFTIGDETTDDDAISVPIVSTVMGVVRARGSVTEVQYSFESNGAIQYEGDASPFGAQAGLENWPVPHNAAKSDLAAITVTHATGRTAAGSAFWQSFQIGRSTTDVISGTLNLQGSGALTLA